MGFDAKDVRIAELLDRTHFYVDPRGYVCVHMYTSLQMEADYFSRAFDGNVGRHKEIFDVALFHRSKIERFCLKVVSLQLQPQFQESFPELVAVAKLVLLYCREADPTRRIDISVMIKSALELVGSES